MKTRKLLCILCAAALCLSLSAPALAVLSTDPGMEILSPAIAAESAKAPAAVDAAQFPDAADIQHWEAVATLTQLGIVNGKEDGAFHPADPVTRAEAAKLLVALAGNPEPSGEPAPFSDIDGHWAKSYIERCTQMGIISGRGDGTFDPDGLVGIYELAKMALVLIGYEAEEYRLTGSRWLMYTHIAVHDSDLYEGLTDGTPSFATSGETIENSTPVSREKCVQLLYNALKADPCPGKLARAKDGTVIMEPTPEGGFQFKYVPSQVFLSQEFQTATLPPVPTQPGKTRSDRR